MDLIVEMADAIIPFEVKYQSHTIQSRDVQGLIDLCTQKPAIKQGYIITKSPQDIGLLQDTILNKKCMRIPASLFCYWLGAAEFVQKNILI